LYELPTFLFSFDAKAFYSLYLVGTYSLAFLGEEASQAQKPNKGDTTSQAFNDAARSLLAVLDKLIRDFSALVGIFIFVLLTSVYLILLSGGMTLSLFSS
jgi:hypothetical protein